MRITLINEEKYEKLKSIYSNHPNLSLQNVGYQYIKKEHLTDEDRLVLKEVTDILREAIVGFSEFNNFKLNKKGEVQIRVQYNYGAEDDSMPFTGVGYLLLDELYYGFR